MKGVERDGACSIYEGEENAHRGLVGKHEGITARGRSPCKWKDEINPVHIALGDVDWNIVAQDRVAGGGGGFL
jgi:hypothetical protein